MKKILTLSMVLALSCSASFAGFGDSLKQAVKSDIEATKADLKEAVQKDIEAKSAENKTKTNKKLSEAKQKKAERIAEFDAKIKELNNDLKEVKDSKTMTNTEKSFRTKSLERQIEFYTKQKEALK